MKLRYLPALLGLMLLVSPALAQGVIHDENIPADGDLSGSPAAPTSVVFGLGTNTIIGSLGPVAAGGGGATNGNDADIFTFTLGAGQSITSFSTTRTGTGTQSFIGYANSNSFLGINNTDLDGGNLFGQGFLNTTGITPIPTTFGPGDHTFVLQEIGAAVDYTISFEVASVVPEPSSAALLGGLAMVGFIRRRRR